ncbi:MAG: lipopolysaccharide assembly protein LapA domain-containing protein [Phycisphaerae bacterium]
MNNNKSKGYLLTIFSGLVIIAAAMLVLFNSGPTVEIRLFNYVLYDVSLGLVMVVSGLVGAFVLLTVKWLVIGIWAIFKGRREDNRVHRQAERLNKKNASNKSRQEAAGGDSAAHSQNRQES